MFARYFVELGISKDRVEATLSQDPSLWMTRLAEHANRRGDTLLADVGFGENVRIARTVEIEFAAALRQQQIDDDLAGRQGVLDVLLGRHRVPARPAHVIPEQTFANRAERVDVAVRAGAHATDPGVFIRSMATRGQLGGLAAAARQAIRVLDASGTPWIVVETVGVGQVEIDIAAGDIAHAREGAAELERIADRYQSKALLAAGRAWGSARTSRRAAAGLRSRAAGSLHAGRGDPR